MEEKSKKVKNRKFVYVLKHDFKTTWNILKDMKKTNRMTDLLNEGFCSPPVFNKMLYTWELGAEYKMLHKNMIWLYVKTENVVEEENFAKIKWKITSDTPFPGYYYIYTIYGDITGTLTTLVLDIEYEREISQTKREIEDGNLELYMIYQNIDECIKNEKIAKTQKEEIIINKNFAEIWYIVVNFKEFHKLIPLTCDSVEYEGDILEEGKKVVFSWDKSHKGVVFLNVKSLFQAYDFAFLVLESYESIPAVPQQLIEWRLEKIDEEKCNVKLIHKYNETIKKESLQHTSKVKKKILQTLKKKLEVKMNN